MAKNYTLQCLVVSSTLSIKMMYFFMLIFLKVNEFYPFQIVNLHFAHDKGLVFLSPFSKEGVHRVNISHGVQSIFINKWNILLVYIIALTVCLRDSVCLWYFFKHKFWNLRCMIVVGHFLHRRLYMLLLFKAYKTQLYGSPSFPLYLLLSRVKTTDFQIQNINTFKK